MKKLVLVALSALFMSGVALASGDMGDMGKKDDMQKEHMKKGDMKKDDMKNEPMM